MFHAKFVVMFTISVHITLKALICNTYFTQSPCLCTYKPLLKKLMLTSAAYSSNVFRDPKFSAFGCGHASRGHTAVMLVLLTLEN